MLRPRLAAAALALGVLLLCLGASCNRTVPPDAQPATEAWLALVDRGDYAGSWREAAPTFKAAVASPLWEMQVAAARAPLGKVTSRKVSSTTYTRALPGAPDGEYVVFVFDTAFEHKTGAVETVIPMKDPDGRWRVSAYFIR